MAFPVGHEDLQKLKSFIDFVSTNPTILNYPQLEFVKVFIEKFGGKVPPGEFKMPGGGCPFGGGGTGGGSVKTEPKQAEPEVEPEPEEAEMDSESESDVELDMEVAAGKYQNDSNSTNAVYLQDSLQKKRKRKRKAVEKKKHIDVHIKLESKELSEDEAFDMDNMEKYDSYDESDPIDTAAEVIIKTESDFEDYEEPFRDANYNEKSTASKSDSSDSDDDTNLQNLAVKLKHKTRQNRKRKLKSDKEFWETFNKRSKRKRPKPINCPVNCKHKCKDHISQAERKAHCAEYWSLNFVQRKNFLLDLVETKKIGRIMKRKTDRIGKGYTNRYFMKSEGKKVRVCLNFFLSTLSVSNGVVKNAMENRDCKGRYVGYDKRGKKPDLENTGENIADEEKLEQNDVHNVEKSSTEILDKSYDTVDIKNPSLTDLLQQKDSLKTANLLQKKESTHTTTKFGWNKGRKLKKDRAPQPVKCDESCQMKCLNHFTEAQRVQICQAFWTMDFKRRKDFVLSKIETREVLSMTAKEFRKSDRAQRTFSNRYFFKGSRGENVRVCAKFFMATLCIGRNVINNALLKADKQTGAYAGEDGRGKHSPGNKISEEMISEIKRHIESYPTWVPHKNHKTRFLHSSLSIQKLWRDYKQICVDQSRRYASAAYFSRIFHKSYKLAFLKQNSKHSHKVSAKKKDDVPAGSTPKKINTNISDFTGEEGGFWIKPSHQTETDRQSLYDLSAATNLQTTEQTFNDNKRNILHIQENVQLHAPQPATTNAGVIVNPYFSAMSYVQPQQPDLLEQMHADPNIPMQSYAIPGYESQHAVFRML